MVAGPFRSTDARAGQVGFRHKYGEGRRPLPQTGPYAVVVRVQRLPAGWWVLGVDGRSIQIRLRTLEGGWLELPRGAGKVVLSVTATNAQRVRFTLTPTGTGMGSYTKLLGEDRDPSDGFLLVWRNNDEPLLAHLGIRATGPGGTAGRLLDIVHTDV
jgi:hypothetical protein